MKDRFIFRAWNTHTKTMKEVSQLSLDEKQVAEYAPTSKVSIHLNFQPHFILMQCTGLKDKNGELIYEGDIVKINNNIYQIVYEIGSFMIVSNDESKIHPFKNSWNDNVYPLSQLYFEYENEELFIDKLEVIGNVFENPELIENEEE